MDKNKGRGRAQAALVLLYGTVHKHYPLNRDVLTIGRARGCDLPLEAVDVSSLHSIIWRTSTGFQVRDCGSRAGTHVNGERVEETALRDGDVFQVGPFSFRVELPPTTTPAARQELRLQHLTRSRRKLAKLALALRARLRKTNDVPAAKGTPQELNQKASGLRLHFRAYEQKLRQLEEAERDLSCDREMFDRERAEHLERIRLAEQDLAQRQQQLEADLQKRWRDLQERVEKNEMNQAPDMNLLLEAQRQALEQAGQALREQRVELAQIAAELRQVLRPEPPEQTDTQAIVRENERLHRLLAEREQQLLAQHQELSELQSRPAQPVVPPELVKEVEALRAQNERLLTLAEERNQELQALQRSPEPSRGEIDLDGYEAELNRYRQQLEADRNKLNQEMQHLKVRNQELDEATREMEMEFSRERAELARERTRLERLREETKADLERLQRDAGMRESLVSVQKLREGFSHNRTPMPPR